MAGFGTAALAMVAQDAAALANAASELEGALRVLRHVEPDEVQQAELRMLTQKYAQRAASVQRALR